MSTTRMGVAPIDTIKIYGDRNTGTRVLARAIEANFSVRLLKPGQRPRQAELEAEVKRRKGFLARRGPVEEAVVDEGAAGLVASDFGWKHAVPPVEAITAAPGRAARCLFVVVTKHPLFFVASLHRRPYHDLRLRWPKPSLSRFVRQPWPTVGRELMDGAIAATPADLWRAKAEGYRRLLAAVPHGLHLRYEDFVADYDGALDRIAAALGRPGRPAGGWKRPETSTKGDDASFADYARRYDLARAGDGFFREDAALVAARASAVTMAAFGYAPADPAALPPRPWHARLW